MFDISSKLLHRTSFRLRLHCMPWPRVICIPSFHLTFHQPLFPSPYPSFLPHRPSGILLIPLNAFDLLEPGSGKQSLFFIPLLPDPLKHFGQASRICFAFGGHHHSIHLEIGIPCPLNSSVIHFDLPPNGITSLFIFVPSFHSTLWVSHCSFLSPSCIPSQGGSFTAFTRPHLIPFS